MTVVLGIDSSTQSTKVEARRVADGVVVARGHAAHPPTTPPVSEQHPDAWWQALVESVLRLPAEVRAEVTALSVAGQQHGLVLLDAHGEVVRPAKLWNDTTSAPEAAAIVERLGAEAWARSCGSVPVASFTIAKLAWMAAHEPGSIERAARVLLPHDLLTYRLTGRFVTDRGDASGTGYYSPATGTYRPELLDAAGLDGAEMLDRLPEVLAPWQAAGPITAEAATALGLPAGVLVGPGTGDNMGAALGLGVRPGEMVISLGTSGVVSAVSAAPTADASGAVAGFADATGHYLPLVCTLNATKVTDAVGRWLGVDTPGLVALALAAPADALGDPVMVPYLDGERTPNRPDASGLIGALRTDTSRESLARAAHDGVVCGLLDGLDALVAAGAPTPQRVFLVGGGARSEAYRRRLADLHGAPIVVPDLDEAVATGAAVQAAMVFEGTGDAAGPGPMLERWGLGGGRVVEPGPGADQRTEIRARYHRFAVHA